MEYRRLEITLISAKDLQDVNLLYKMDVYAVVTINGDTQTKQKTSVDKDCGSNPNWNHTMKFTVDEAAANQNRLNFVIRLVSDRHFGDKDIGEVVVTIEELIYSKEKVLSYNVRMPNGKVKGTLNFSCKIGKKFSAPVAAPPYVAEKGKVGEIPVMACPAVRFRPAHQDPAPAPAPAPPPVAYPYNYPPPGGYPPPPPVAYPYNYPPPGGYPPPPQPYGYAPPPPAVGYGYPGYPPYGGYGYMPAQKPQKQLGPGAGLGLGLAGGLLGGLVVGEMVSDVDDALDDG
ncbi:hypothetical protein SLE2022_126190 [Rubroshorea leprosula]